MKLSILTTITNPKERQDKCAEALNCYCALADEVVVVDGGVPPMEIRILGEFMTWGYQSSEDWEKLKKERKKIIAERRKARYVDLGGKAKFVRIPWPDEWNWIELPRHLNAGLEECTGDWVIKLDIDQFIHENDFLAIRQKMEDCLRDVDVLTFQKMSMTYGKKYYQKGGQPIAFRNKPYIKIGKNVDIKTDLCFPVDTRGYESEVVERHPLVKGRALKYLLPRGKSLKSLKTGISYFNYDYFFKTKEFTKKEFWRFSKAYYRYFGEWTFGKSEEESFDIFLDMMKGRHDKAPYTYKLGDHPTYIREAVKNLKPEQFGYNAWEEVS